MQTLYIWGQSIVDDGISYHIHIDKPIYGTCVAVSSKVIDSATAAHRLLTVSCPGASETLEPFAWVMRSERISKVFRDPKHPMILYQGSIGPAQPKERIADTVKQLSLLS